MIYETLDPESKAHVQRQLDYYHAAEPAEQARLLGIADAIMNNPTKYDERVVWLAMSFYERLMLWMAEQDSPGAGHA